jgi:hypothetical protein
MSKYETLVNILDQLRKEAPPENKRYYHIETDLEKVNQARSRAFIHLFLKVKFGLLDFKERERVVTDGPYDSGIDAYYIDKELNFDNYYKGKTLNYDLIKFFSNSKEI